MASNTTGGGQSFYLSSKFRPVLMVSLPAAKWDSYFNGYGYDIQLAYCNFD